MRTRVGRQSETLGVVTVNSSGTATSWFFNVVALNRVVGRQPNTGSRSYYHTDLLGSTRAVVQGATVVESYDFEPWGLLMPGRTLGSGTKEGFTRKEQDAETGLDYFGARYYMPAVGRWTSVDPKADSFPEWSTYNYVKSNPVAYTDPFGLQDCQKNDVLCAARKAGWGMLGALAGLGRGAEFGAAAGALCGPGVEVCAPVGALVGGGIGAVSGFMAGRLAFEAAEGAAGGSSSGSSGPSIDLGAWARRYNLNAASSTTENLLTNRVMKVSDFIAQFRKGSITHVFPSEFLDKTVEEALAQGGSMVRKLLVSSKYVK